LKAFKYKKKFWEVTNIRIRRNMNEPYYLLIQRKGEKLLATEKENFIILVFIAYLLNLMSQQTFLCNLSFARFHKKACLKLLL